MIKVITGYRGRNTAWSVDCSGSCKTGCSHHYVTRNNQNVFSCNCPGCHYGYVCTHIKQVWKFETEYTGYRVTFHKTYETAKKQHRYTSIVRIGGRKLYATFRKTASALFPISERKT